MLFEFAGKGKSRAVINRLCPLEQIAQVHGYLCQGHNESNVVMGSP